MGRAKEEWMRHQELEPMYEWIEENYGDDAGEEGSETWEQAVQAYEDRCEELQWQEAAWYEQEELEWYIYTQSQVGKFDTQIQSVLELLDVQASSETQFSLLVMLHGHIVAAVESYLASTFIHKVTNSEELIRKLVETDPVFSKTKFTFKDIYEKHENLKLTVATYLRDLIFHDLAKVKPMFKDVLGCDFGDISWLFEAVKIRHHCVHRAGHDKDGNKVDISKESIRNLANRSSNLVHAVETRIDQISRSDLEF
ncbi:hypothetical protein [Marinobacter subterrani]|uniref:RiboL-PSP-HEPN domain-containing protein n=1 Tax=Marinobacter subterrani TaxID=1658765 RepID=A0A0J7J869_9GAMM|nr:hypothetical protein [Marinobacter subterrani]KMQ74397.1 hypothetical protein Msub_10580 [Marinobacter subterrani]